MFCQPSWPPNLPACRPEFKLVMRFAHSSVSCQLFQPSLLRGRQLPCSLMFQSAHHTMCGYHFCLYLRKVVMHRDDKCFALHITHCFVKTFQSQSLMSCRTTPCAVRRPPLRPFSLSVSASILCKPVCHYFHHSLGLHIGLVPKLLLRLLCRQRPSHLQNCQLALRRVPQAPHSTILFPTTCGSVAKRVLTTA